MSGKFQIDASSEDDKGLWFSTKSIPSVPIEVLKLIDKVKDADSEVFARRDARSVVRHNVFDADCAAFQSPAYEEWVAVDARIKECSSRATNAFAAYDAARSAQVEARTAEESVYAGDHFDSSCVACDEKAASHAALSLAASQAANAHGDIATAYKTLADVHSTLAVAYAAAHAARLKCKAANDMLSAAESEYDKARSALAVYGAEAVAACDAVLDSERKRRYKTLTEASESKRTTPP